MPCHAILYHTMPYYTIPCHFRPLDHWCGQRCQSGVDVHLAARLVDCWGPVPLAKEGGGGRGWAPDTPFGWRPLNSAASTHCGWSARAGSTTHCGPCPARCCGWCLGGLVARTALGPVGVAKRRLPPCLGASSSASGCGRERRPAEHQPTASTHVTSPSLRRRRANKQLNRQCSGPGGGHPRTPGGRAVHCHGPGRTLSWSVLPRSRHIPPQRAASPFGEVAVQAAAAPLPWALGSGGLQVPSNTLPHRTGHWAVGPLRYIAALQRAMGCGRPSVSCAVVWCGVVWCGVVWCSVV